MRIDEIDIRGFGRLRDIAIPLGPRVTVILGENETGKSTLHRIIRAGLYGLDAGGQGRAVERSEWMRWTPWSAGPYGFALTLSTDAGRRLRIAARLDSREQTVQVFEIGGGDVTAAMRHGRVVAPGLHLLGIDEAVFCATSWLGEDGLRMGAPDTASQRARSLQEAVERLADSGRGTTAAEATARLRAALDRVGSERRAHSPLGVATSRSRQLQAEIDAARRRFTAFAADQQMLTELETVAEQARAHQTGAECAWLVGRLAALGAQRVELQRATAEAADLNTTLAATAAAAQFPVENEPAVLALFGEWRQACASATEVEARFEAAAPTLERARRRRAEITAGLAALGDVVDLDEHARRERAQLTTAMEAAQAEAQRLNSNGDISGRIEALRREIAATGLGGLRLGSAETVAGLIEQARAGRSSRLPDLAAMLVAGLAAVSALGLGFNHRPALGGLAAVAGLIGSGLIQLTHRLLGDGGTQARRQLSRVCPDLDLSDAGLSRAAERLPALTALHDDLLRQEVRAASQREQAERAAQSLAAVAERAESLAAWLGIDHDDAASSGDDPGSRARVILAQIDTVIENADRRTELENEDAALAETEAALVLLAAEAEHTRTTVAGIEAQFRDRLGNPAGVTDLTGAVTAFSRGCELRRQHDLALAQLAALRPQLGLADADTHLDDLAAQLTRDLIDRGGNPAQAATAEPLNPTQLAGLEREAEQARQRAESASAQSTGLRSRLAGAFEGLPNLADLEDELRLCQSAVARATRQRLALTRAIEILEASTRGVHRELAPRLASSISARLSRLTESRYDGVNVDTDHFAIALQGSERPDLIPLEQVSHGTRDQVALLLRLALAEVLSDCGESVPLFLDEPLLSADPQRRDLTLDFLCHISESHQVVLTSNDPLLADAVVARIGAAAAVITLDSVTTPAFSVDGVRVGLVRARTPS